MRTTIALFRFGDTRPTELRNCTDPYPHRHLQVTIFSGLWLAGLSNKCPANCPDGGMQREAQQLSQQSVTYNASPIQRGLMTQTIHFWDSSGIGEKGGNTVI